MLLLIKKLVIDSSVIVSTLGKPDKFTKISERFFRKIGSEPQTHVTLPTIVIAETIVNLYKQNSRNVAKKIKILSKYKIVPLDTKFTDKFVDLAKGHNLKTSDLIIAATAKLNKATLISWDRKHLEKDQKICKAMSPSRYLKQLGS